MDQGDPETAGGATGATGVLPPDVMTALEHLESLGGLPVTAHVAAFEEVQRSLDDALADIDGAPGGSGGQPRPSRSLLPPQPPRPAPGPHGPVPGGRRGERGNPLSRDEA